MGFDRQNQYEYCFIGCGPSTIFACLDLIKCNRLKKTIIFEKGEEMSKRSPNIPQNGFGGSGTFSDFKLTYGANIGGILVKNKIINLQEYKTYSNRILTFINEFLPNGFHYNVNQLTNTVKKDKDKNWISNNCVHIGTKNGREVLFGMEKRLKKAGIKFRFNESVSFDDIKYIQSPKGSYWEVKDIETKNLIIGTGPNDIITSQLIEEFNLKTMKKPNQIGVRLEDIGFERYKNIIDKNYDFKFHIENGSDRIRTFCCNSGSAEVTKELNDGKFISFNGHALGNGQNNNRINFGIILESNLGWTKQEQINFCKQINESNNTEPQTLEEFQNNTLKLYPQIYQTMFAQMIDLLDVNFKLKTSPHCKIYSPEIKLIYNDIPQVSKNMESSLRSLFFIGDVVLSRSILQAGTCGILFSKGLI